MQISKEKFDGFVEEIHNLTQKEREARDIARDLQRQVNNFDEILEKIIRAAQGAPLIQRGDVGYGAMTPGYGYGDGSHQCQPPTAQELQARMLDEQFSRNVDLQSRVSAVIAVATFAKEHKS